MQFGGTKAIVLVAFRRVSVEQHAEANRYILAPQIGLPENIKHTVAVRGTYPYPISQKCEGGLLVRRAQQIPFLAAAHTANS